MTVGFLFLCAFVQWYWLYRLMKKSDECERRIKALETRKPEPEKRVQAPAQVVKQPAQYEKPVVPGAKEVKPLPIGGGKQVLDYETQVAEWV